MKRCDFCDQEGARKVRIDVFPWMRKCVYICAPCTRELPTILSEMQEDADQGLTAHY